METLEKRLFWTAGTVLFLVGVFGWYSRLVARRYGIDDDDTVTVESPYGRVTGRAKLSERMHPEVVGLQHGFGHTALGRNAEGRGTADGRLRPTKADPLSGMSLHKECCVRIRRS
jgi:thiosulfate reductase/polysulfide reductase chain A